MDFALFSSNQKRKVIEFIEIEAKSTSQADKRGLFFLLSSQFEFEHFFRLEFVLHEAPVHHSSV